MMRSLAFLLLMSLGQAQAVSVPSSGIDWDRSSLKILTFETPFSESHNVFNCFGKKIENLPIEIYLSRFGFDKQGIGPTTVKETLAATDCFQAAGTYRVLVSLIDGAGNKSESESDLVFDPGKVSAENTQITPLDVQQYRNTDQDFIRKISSDCTNENLVANGLDTCNFSLSFHDEFGNRVTSEYLKNIKINFPGVDPKLKRLKIINETQNAFHQGIRLSDGQVEGQLSSEDVRIDQSFKFGLKSWMPTIEVVESSVFPFLAVESKTLPIQIRLGIEETDGILSEFNTELDIKYRPLINLEVDGNWSLESHFYATLGSWSPFYVLPKFTSGSIIPTQLAVVFRGKADKDSSVRLKGPGKAEGETYQISTNRQQSQEALNFQFLAKSLKPELKSVFQLFGTIGYVVKDPIFGSKLVQYPMTIVTGESIGKTMIASWQTLQVGADIEGKVISKNKADQDPSTVFFANIQSEVREDLARNTYSLIRGVDPWDTDVININKDLSSPVSYVKGRNVRLTASNDRGAMIFGGGRRTIVIEDGNLLIDRDLVYKSEEDSLGIILINKTPNVRDKGNLFINQQVKVFSGTYFLDGSLLSTIAKKPEDLDITATIKNRTQTNNENPNAAFGYQLLLNGTIISRNTWGGANQTPIVDPWKKEVDFETAIRYDLDYMRRYEPTRDTENEVVVDKFNDYCVKIEDRCDVNPHAFIIRPDGRVKVHTPPGFSQIANTSLISDS